MTGMPQSDPAITASRQRTFLLWAIYLVFVVYGSLVPLDFAPMPLEQAWERFAQIRMLALGADSRADWIANGVLYAALGFLSAQLFLYGSTTRRWLRLLVAAAFCSALALGIEFAQLFFPPRTVSLNDIVAELIGSLVGLGLAMHGRRWFAALLDADVVRLCYRLLEAYLAAYLALSLFPYDFLLSVAEFSTKLNSDNWGWLISGRHGGPVQIIVKSAIEILLTAPVGVLLGVRATPRPASYRTAVLCGVALGASIEVSQFLTYSGIAQGISILTRGLGTCLGLVLWQHREAYPLPRVRDVVARYAAPLTALYIVALLSVNGWISAHWSNSDVALSRLDKLHFLPFYYHYYTTETHALVSALTTALMYLPVGVMVWAKHGSARQALVAAGLTAACVECGKLFIVDVRPDPTNVLLAAVVSWLSIRIFREIDGSRRQESAPPHPTVDAAPAGQSQPNQPLTPSPKPKLLDYAGLIVALALCSYAIASFPVTQLWLGTTLVAAAVIVWSRPQWMLAVVAAALPILDLTPWSGRFFVDEFDMLLVISVAVGNVRIARSTDGARQKNGDAPFTLLLWLLAASFAISALRGLLPWPAPDTNALASYFSPFNAIRIAKGVFWAMLILSLLRRQLAAQSDVFNPLAWGTVTGLTLTVTFIVWERLAFSGLFNFAADYRVTGPFSAMHTGGAYVECFLAVALPFLLLLLLKSRFWAIRTLGTLLLLGTTYALMVTFSRGGYLAFGVALTLFLFFALFRSTTWKRNVFLAAALGVALFAVAWPVFTGSYAQSRLTTVSNDFDIRQRHWREALEIRSGDWATTLFGVGLGRFPEHYYLFSSEGGRTATYQFKDEDGNRYLRLRSGSSLYFEQLVSMEAKQRYRLTLDARSDQPNASLTVPICEKWLLSSYNCSWNGFKLGDENDTESSAGGGTWKHFESTVSTASFRDDPVYSRRPIKLALYNGGRDAVVDVDNVRLVRLDDTDGENLLRNGDFSAGIDHWFFSVDSHLQWHIKSLPVAVLFDQGWFGAFAVGLFTLCAIVRAGRRAWHGDLQAAAALAALAAFMVVGLFDTLIDAPRFLMLLVLLGGVSNFALTNAVSNHLIPHRK